MMELADILVQMQGGTEFSEGVFSSVGNFLRQLGLGAGELSAGSAAVVLAAVWVFARVVRTVVSILFVICVLLLVLQLTGTMDTSAVWETVGGWLSPEAPAKA